MLAVGLFDGIAAVRCAWDLLGLAVCGFVSVECEPAAKRVVASAWPGVLQVIDMLDIDGDMIRAWRRKFPTAVYVLLSAGLGPVPSGTTRAAAFEARIGRGVTIITCARWGRCCPVPRVPPAFVPAPLAFSLRQFIGLGV